MALAGLLLLAGCSKEEESNNTPQVRLKAVNITVRALGTAGTESIQLKVGSTVVATWTLTKSFANYTASTNATGTVVVQFTNDATGRDVQIDYAQFNGATYQAENQATNTGVWQNNNCGGSNSEWLHCGGYIQFPSLGGSGSAATINLTSLKQVIDGFGASTAWHGQISEAEANAGFNNSTNSQMGLSILRIRIDPNGSSYWGDELSNVWKAKSRGAKILATPWTPPASMKNNNSTVAGELKTTEYANYANWLNSFRTYMANANGAVDVVSIQNEPNIRVTYESCDWTPTQLLNFCKNNAQSIGGSVMMPEAYNFATSYSDPSLNDATAVTKFSHIGGHLYGASPFNYTLAINKGKKVWMTEHYFDGDDINVCMNMAKEINDCMANNMHAYIWWYLRLPSCNLMTSNGSLTKKGYTMGQFSKYIRPGYQRIDATYNPSGNVYVTAYKGTKVVIVAINVGTSAVSQSFTIQNGTVSSVTPHITSSSKNISNEATVNLSNNSFTYTLPAQSITTFVQN